MTSTGKTPDILYLVHRVPYPPDKGDRIRAYHILRFLARHANIHLACLADESVPENTVQKLKSLYKNVAIVLLKKTRWLHALKSFALGGSITTGAFQSAALNHVLQSWCGTTKFSAALVSASSLVPYLRLPELRHIPAVVDLVDVDSQKWLDYSKLRSWPLSWIFTTEGRRLRKLEKDLPTWARAVTLVSEPEADIYRQFAAGGQISAVTNGVDLDYFSGAENPSKQYLKPSQTVPNNVPESAQAAPTCVFVGALDYFPNIDGVLWFCKEVWPRIHRQNPLAKFALVGRRPVPAILQLAEIPGVEVIGEVPDVRPHLQNAAVALIPLRIARGLQNKVTEALAMSKAVVASPQALAALHTKPGVHLLSATTPEEWQTAVLRLLQDEPLRQRLGTAGRAYVEQNHNWDHCLQPLLPLLGLKHTSPKKACDSCYPLEVTTAVEIGSH